LELLGALLGALDIVRHSQGTEQGMGLCQVCREGGTVVLNVGQICQDQVGPAELEARRHRGKSRKGSAEMGLGLRQGTAALGTPAESGHA